MIYARRKRYGGHWIMRGEDKIGEAWKYPKNPGFGMSIGGHLTNLPVVYWRDGRPSKFGSPVIAAYRLSDLVAIAERHFGKEKS